jgi:uncharacterized membrane-anchored protein YitT (DUF2179 family)
MNKTGYKCFYGLKTVLIIGKGRVRFLSHSFFNSFNCLDSRPISLAVNIPFLIAPWKMLFPAFVLITVIIRPSVAKPPTEMSANSAE